MSLYLEEDDTLPPGRYFVTLTEFGEFGPSATWFQLEVGTPGRFDGAWQEVGF